LIEAAAENPTIQSIYMNGFRRCPSIRAASWGKLRSHPNLQELYIPRDSSPECIEMIQGVIETCPSIHAVGIPVEDIASQKLRPILESLKKVNQC
jgi:hypothetical protein